MALALFTRMSEVGNTTLENKMRKQGSMGSQTDSSKLGDCCLNSSNNLLLIPNITRDSNRVRSSSGLAVLGSRVDCPRKLRMNVLRLAGDYNVRPFLGQSHRRSKTNSAGASAPAIVGIRRSHGTNQKLEQNWAKTSADSPRLSQTANRSHQRTGKQLCLSGTYFERFLM